ncbi:MAG: RHS repeat-associated core domain-containing protein, partial [Pirellulaceae bacterium]|nr:RHS repeat-associated core domain-containing protein [Pirellulaceae bacterium]
AKYSTAVPIAVYDGSAATGALQQTFNLDETTLHWSNWEVGGYDWNWSDGVFYSNSGTVTVRVGVGADGVTQAPAIRLIAAPDSVACNAPASSDPVNLASGKMQSCGCGDDVEGTYYNNLSAGFLGDSGYGMTDARPALVGQGMLVTFTDAEGCPGDQWIEPVRNYTPQYGTKATLIDKGTYLELTQPDGTIHHFGYPTHDAYSIGPWMSTTLPGGRSETVTQWVTVAGKEKMGEIQYKSSPTAHAYYSEVFTYYDDLDPNAGLRESITYRNWDADASAWVNDQKVEYTYYETSQTELNGASGDLKTATVHYWDPAANGGSGGWSGGDTTYFRYYTGPTYEGEFPNEVFVGFAHGLKRKLLPEAYAKAAEYAAGLEPAMTVEELSDEDIARYTCFYYKYNADRQVTFEEVYGQLRTTTYEYTEGTNVKDANLWANKTIEVRPDGNTYTVYSNFLGEALLTDLCDTKGTPTTADDEHWYVYNRYDVNGNVLLDASSSAIAGYEEDAFTLGQLNVTGTDFGASGLVHVYTYYDGDDTATATTPGGVVNYLASVGVAEGLADALAGTNIIVTAEYTYYKNTVGSGSTAKTVYHLAEEIKYTETNHTGAITTSYDDANLWYTGTVKLKQETLVLPVISQAQNGSGAADTTKTWYDQEGNLTWTLDQAGRATYYHHDSATGRVDYVIEDVDSDLSSGLNPPTGYAGNADGLHLRTDYEYDLTGRVVQVLGPEHADAEGTLVRTASWVVYKDGDHTTYSAQGYAWWDTSVSEWNYTLVNPVSITVTNRDGDILEQIQAVAETTALDAEDPRSTIAAETFSQSEYTAWTTYHYSRKQLVAVRVYHGIANELYDETQYGYDPLGRSEWTETPEGTITWNVLDARGLVVSTWVGTDATGATHSDPSNGGTNEMVIVSANIYDYGNDQGDSLLTESRTYFGSGTNDYYATQYAYDWRGRLIEMVGPDPDGQGELTGPVTEYAYDNLDRMIQQTDPLGHVTTYDFDDLGRQYRVTQPDPDGEGDLESPVTNYYYDPVGRLASLVDPVGNTTSWVYDGLGRMIEETNELDDTRSFEYDNAGNLIQKIDRNGRVTQYGYDGIGRTVEENWLDSQESVIWTISHAYDSAGRLESVGDDAAEFDYAYDDAGRVLTETQTIAGLSPVIVFASQYDGNGNRAQLAATIGEDDDFVTDYYYDYLDRLERIEQYGVQGGNAVAEKRVDLTYNLAGQFDAITRYKDLDGGSGNLAMTGTCGYDLAGRLTGLAYTDSLSATLRGFGWSYDAANRIIGHDSDIASEDVAANGYGYDATNQLTSADYTDANRDDESFAYDENGNRTEANGQTYGTPVAANRLSTDGYYTYKYDAEGNLEYRFMDEDASGDLTTGDTEVTEYTWDHRNRLTKVAYRPEVGEPVDWAVDYVYDSLNRRIASLYDSDGDATVDREERYVWDGNNIALDFVDPDGATGGEQSAPLALATRYLWGQAVDQLLAQEAVDDGGPEDVAWPVTDNLGSVRSLADTTGAVTATFSYDTYGTVTVLEGSLTDTRYLYTCQEYDLATGLYYYNARWYDPATGRFVSEDPIGFNGSPWNLYEYVENSPTNATDPGGLAPPSGSQPKPGGSIYGNGNGIGVRYVRVNPDGSKCVYTWIVDPRTGKGTWQLEACYPPTGITVTGTWCWNPFTGKTEWQAGYRCEPGTVRPSWFRPVRPWCEFKG